MRSTYNVEPIRLAVSREDPEGEAVTVGISLAGAGCAEHEMGADRLRKLLGMPPQRDAKVGDSTPPPLGLEGWLMRETPRDCALLQEQGHDLILVVHKEVIYESVEREQVSPAFMRLKPMPTRFLPPSFDDRMVFGDEKRPRAPRNKAERAAFIEATQGLRAAWDERGFSVRARGTEARAALMTVADAYAEGRLLVGVGAGPNPFDRSGLRLMDRALMPEWVINEAVEMDLQHRALLKAAHDTGVEAMLAAAGKQFIALKPSWTHISAENGLLGLVPEGTVHFWLNPQNQNEDGYGYMSVEDLRDWAEGKGCIPGAGRKYPEVRERGGWIDSMYDRMRERLDPEGTDMAHRAARDAGVDLTTGGEEEKSAFVLRPFLTDGSTLGAGDISCLWANFRRNRAHGWFTAAEVSAYQQGEPSVLDEPSKEMRTFEEMCSTLNAAAVPRR